ncbi:uncharacterized protein JN550_009531 [Neoarthrinium moseri]|uniref:uncharacterized protein n=1 Tax=Neoarthrinium moseri TaxID=1658444 RepID=UPI001FDE90C6|nr:uncharacterized protein JN550_009531 [Neoarthrinium moseri]KAI1863420.1 hypothetical protein JN550_009531 [Neoarthrinium moseri]
MDDHIFDQLLQGFKYVPENTSYLEIFNYTDPVHDVIESRPLTPDEFQNFLQRQGAYAAPVIPKDVQLKAGLRIIVQENAKHRDTFTSHYITLPPDVYRSMMMSFGLPLSAIECTSTVGPLFWSSYNHDESDPQLHIIVRKADMRKKGKTRGWELVLSYSFRDKITTAFLKGTPCSNVSESLKLVKDSPSQICHPLLLPMTLAALYLNGSLEQRTLDGRQSLRQVEDALTFSRTPMEDSPYNDLDLNIIGRDLVEINSAMLRSDPEAWMGIIGDAQKALSLFFEYLPECARSPEITKAHHKFSSRLSLYNNRLQGMKGYVRNTQRRLEIQKFALSNLSAQRDGQVNLENNAEQRRLAHLSKQDSSSMKALSLVGVIFLPGTFLASIFSMSFFDFKGGK